MTVNETAELMEIISIAYPNFYKNYSDDKKRKAIELWATIFSEYPYALVLKALQAVISVSQFPPTIADVKAKITLLTVKPQMSEMEAWGLVKQALSNCAYHSSEEFEELPPMIQKLVGSPETLFDWCMMDTDKLDTVVQSNFMRSWKVIAAREEATIALPSPLAKEVRALAESLDIKTPRLANKKLEAEVEEEGIPFSIPFPERKMK